MKFFLLKFFAFFTGCVSCYFLQQEFNFGAVFSSALVGFAGSFIRLPIVTDERNFHGAIYAGSFAGMCSPHLLASYIHVLVLSLIGTVVYVSIHSRMLGFGGKLGATAFVSSFLFWVVSSVW